MDATPQDAPRTTELNRAGRRAEARRLRRAGAALAAVPTALGTTALLLGATALPAGADTLTVTNLDPTGVGSLHDLAEAANDGDVIVFQAGLTGTITLDDTINVDTAITIQGPGADVVTVSGNDSVAIFDINGPGSSTSIDVVISGLTLTKGASNFGSAIVFDDANLTVRDSVITANSSSGGGGAIATDDEDQDLVIENTEITGNSAGDDGGGVYFYSPDGGTFTMTGSTVSANTADDDGGGLWIKGEDDSELGAVTITDSAITGNTADSEGGGAFMYYLSSLTVANTTITGNTAGGDGGGGLFVSYVTGDTSITGSTISGNTAAGYGGGVYFEGMEGTTTIAFTTISDNDAGEGGGGIEFYESEGSLVIRNSTVSGNSSDEYGGGLYVSDSSGPVEIYNSTISGNTAAEEGGGISFEGYYGLTIVQSTIAANSATTVGGIWIYDDSADEVSVRDAEKDAAKAAEKAAKDAEKAEARIAEGKEPKTPRVQEERVRAQAMASVVVNGSIVSLNSGADIGEMGTLELTGSLVGTISGTTLVDQGGNLFEVDPLVGPLTDNGGPTRTHALLPGSPAIDAGPDPVADFVGNEDDQRGPGYPRVVRGRVDIGAFEVQPTTIEPTFTG